MVNPGDDEPPADADDATFEAWIDAVARRKKIGVSELRRRIEDALALGEVFSTPNAFPRGGYTVVHRSAKGKKGAAYQLTWMDDDGPVGDTEPRTPKAAAERVWEDLHGAQRSAFVAAGIWRKLSKTQRWALTRTADRWGQRPWVNGRTVPADVMRALRDRYDLVEDGLGLWRRTAAGREVAMELVRERHAQGWKAPSTGGLADGRSASEFPLDAILRGTAVELEHTSDVSGAMRIAMDHLVEDLAYYEKLASIEGNPDALPVRVSVNHVDVIGRDQHVYRLVATDPDGQVVYGSMLLDVVSDDAFINFVQVDPKYRRRGVATALYAELERWAQREELTVHHGVLTQEGTALLKSLGIPENPRALLLSWG